MIKSEVDELKEHIKPIKNDLEEIKDFLDLAEYSESGTSEDSDVVLNIDDGNVEDLLDIVQRIRENLDSFGSELVEHL